MYHSDSSIQIIDAFVAAGIPTLPGPTQPQATEPIYTLTPSQVPQITAAAITTTTTVTRPVPHTALNTQSIYTIHTIRPSAGPPQLTTARVVDAQAIFPIPTLLNRTVRAPEPFFAQPRPLTAQQLERNLASFRYRTRPAFPRPLIIPGVNQPAGPNNQSRYIDSPYHHAIVARHAAPARHPQQHAAAAAAGAAQLDAGDGPAMDNLVPLNGAFPVAARAAQARPAAAPVAARNPDFLGEGGMGSVSRVRLSTGEEIARKRFTLEKKEQFDQESDNLVMLQGLFTIALYPPEFMGMRVRYHLT